MSNLKMVSGTPEEVGMSGEQIQRVKDLAAGWVEDGTTPSLVVLAARRGKVVLHEAYGVLGPESDSPSLRQDSIFEIASITKVIVATLAMMLVEDGLLGLNRPVQDYIPEFQGEGKDAVLVHHLLTHTSGIDDSAIWELWVEILKESWDRPPTDDPQHPFIGELLLPVYNRPLSKSPGEEMEYSNSSYELLGEIIRRLSGASLTDFARARIFRPLEMDDTDFIAAESIRHRIVQRPPTSQTPYELDDRMSTPLALGGVFGTAADMAVFCQMFLDGGASGNTPGNTRLLSPATVSAMTRNQIPGISTTYKGRYYSEASWGYGWSINGVSPWKYEPGTLVSPGAFRHWGAGGAFTWVDPANELVGIYFSVAEQIDNIDITKAEHFSNAITAAIDD